MGILLTPPVTPLAPLSLGPRMLMCAGNEGALAAPVDTGLRSLSEVLSGNSQGIHQNQADASVSSHRKNPFMLKTAEGWKGANLFKLSLDVSSPTFSGRS